MSSQSLTDEEVGHHRLMIHEISPLRDDRWPAFVKCHSSASIFHTRAWLDALEKTFGYKSVAYTTSPPGAELQNAVVFCRVNSWLTGNRLVSLPFSDHCEPLLSRSDLSLILSTLRRQCLERGLRYIEIRPLEVGSIADGIASSTYNYCFHQLDLKPDLATLFGNLHKDSTRRKIRRAEREGLRYQEGRSDALLAEFYRLFLLTRRRHRVPPQPKSWFRNLIGSFGENIRIRVAFRGFDAIAAIITMRFRETITYKYGCSDPDFHNLGGMHLLFWHTIEEAKREGLKTFDFGRSEMANAGLIKFKDRWGAFRSTLTYWRYTNSLNSAYAFRGVPNDWKLRAAKLCFAKMPPRILSLAGDMLYRHIG